MTTLDAILEQTDAPQTSSYSPYVYDISTAVAFGLYAMARGGKGGQRTAQARMRRRAWHTSKAVKDENNRYLPASNDDPHNQLVAYANLAGFTDSRHGQHYFSPFLDHPMMSTPSLWYDTARGKVTSFATWLFSRDGTRDSVNDLHPENVKRSLVVAGLVLTGAVALSTVIWYGVVAPSFER